VEILVLKLEMLVLIKSDILGRRKVLFNYY
jgi:hypothetical protein